MTQEKWIQIAVRDGEYYRQFAAHVADTIQLKALIFRDKPKLAGSHCLAAMILDSKPPYAIGDHELYERPQRTE